MKLYRSLVYRELKLSRKYYALIGMMLLFLAASLMIVLILPSAEVISADEEAVLPLDLVSIGIGIIGVFIEVGAHKAVNVDIGTFLLYGVCRAERVEKRHTHEHKSNSNCKDF